MPKGEVAIVEGQSKLMDPAGQEFQDMLTAAKTAAVEKLAGKDDTSMVEKDVDDKASSTTAKDETLKPKTVDKEADEQLEPEEVPGDDIGNLKNKVSGLQAELSRVRKKSGSATEEAQSLKERIADMEGQLKVLRENKTTTSLDEKIAQLTDKQVSTNRRMWEDELIDARVEARQAVKDNDPDLVKQANARIAAANDMLERYDLEKDRRADLKVKGKASEEDEKAAVSKDLTALFEEVAQAAPDIFTKDTPIWKAGKAEYDKLPALMKQLGPLGEMVAAAAAIAKHPELVGKKVADKVINNMVDNIERVADKAFNKGGTAPSQGSKPFTTTINNQTDLSNFEAQVRQVKGG